MFRTSRATYVHFDCTEFERPFSLVIGIYGFHMPLFFILSGYIFNKEKYHLMGFKNYFISKFKAYMIPYFLLALINLIIYIPYQCINKITREDFFNQTLTHIKYILLGSGDSTKIPFCTPLWYLPCIFIASLYFYIFLKIKKVSLKVLICIISTIIVCLINRYTFDQLPWHFDIALIGMTFMYVGYIIKVNNVIEKISCDVWFGVSFLIIGLYSIYYSYFNGNYTFLDLNFRKLNNVILSYTGSICMILAILIICYKYLNNARVLSYFGKNTLICLGFNFSINIYSQYWGYIPILRKIKYSWYSSSIVCIVICFILIYLWNLFKQKIIKRRS